MARGFLFGSVLGRLYGRRWLLLLLGHGRDSIRLDVGNLFPQLDDLSFHLRIATALPNSLEVGFDFTVKFQATTTGAVHPWVLNYIAAQLP